MQKFTEEGLNAINKKKLYDLAKYHRLDVTYRMHKSQIIDALIEYFDKITEEDEDQLPEMSVRVRRIYNLNKEG